MRAPRKVVDENVPYSDTYVPIRVYTGSLEWPIMTASYVVRCAAGCAPF